MVTSKLNVTAMAAGVTAWAWYPSLQVVSQVAADILPILTVSWIVYQWITHKRSK